MYDVTLAYVVEDRKAASCSLDKIAFPRVRNDDILLGELQPHTESEERLY
jgi:hypothetical protein